MIASSLIRKELIALRPFSGLIVVICIFSAVEVMFETLHLHTYATIFERYLVGHTETTFTMFFFTLALTSGLLIREYEEGTIEFLDSLPVSRTSIFCAKVIVAIAVLSLLTIYDMGMGLLLHAVSRNSLDPSFHWTTVAQLFGLRTLQLATIFSLGLATSFLRRFGWLAIGVAVWIFMLIKDHIPAIEVFNLFVLSEPGLDAQQCVVPWPQVYAATTMCVIFMAISYLLFTHGDRLVAAYSRMSQTTVGGIVLLAGSIGIGVVAFVLFYYADESGVIGDGSEAEDVVFVEYPSWNTLRSKTAYYNAIYPANLTGKADGLLRSADHVYEKVKEVLGYDQQSTILLDATSTLPRHAGLANWETIRLDLTATNDVKTLQSILGHETAHVMMEFMSDRRLSDVAGSARFWHEGVASYIERHHFETEENIRDYYRYVAFMRSRDEVDFDVLMNNSELEARYDTLVAYPLGMVFIEGLVNRYSEASIGKIVTAMSRDSAPKGLTGMEFWRDTFQSCGYSLDDAINSFFLRLDEEVNNQQEWLDSIPELTDSFSDDEDYIYIELDNMPSGDWDFVCRFRQTRDAPSRQYSLRFFDDDGKCSIYREYFPSGVAWYQVGFIDSDRIMIFEPWVRVAIE